MNLRLEHEPCAAAFEGDTVALRACAIRCGVAPITPFSGCRNSIAWCNFAVNTRRYQRVKSLLTYGCFHCRNPQSEWPTPQPRPGRCPPSQGREAARLGLHVPQVADHRVVDGYQSAQRGAAERAPPFPLASLGGPPFRPPRRVDRDGDRQRGDLASMTTPPQTLREPTGGRLCPDCPVDVCSAARVQNLSHGSTRAHGDGRPFRRLPMAKNRDQWPCGRTL